MKIFIAFCFLFGCIYSAPASNAVLDTQWILFKQSFEKQYATNEEDILRRSIWEVNLEKVRQHNIEAEAGMHSYTLKMNQFGDLTNEEFNKKMNGFNIPSYDQSNNDHYQTFHAQANLKLPDSVDWRARGYVTPVKDQKACASCWAFSATGSLEGQHFAKTGQLTSLSEQNLVDCSMKYGNWGCVGGFMINAFRYIKANGGIDTEESYPYQGHHGNCQFDPKNIGANITNYVRLASQSEPHLETAIATIGPISVAVDASNLSFQLYHSGVYNETACSSTQVNHGVLAVGYGSINGTDYYIVKNSWNTTWGDQGYILMSRHKNNQCGIATDAIYPLV